MAAPSKVQHNGRVTTSRAKAGTYEFSASSLNLFGVLLGGVNLNVGAAGDEFLAQAKALALARTELLVALDAAGLAEEA